MQFMVHLQVLSVRLPESLKRSVSISSCAKLGAHSLTRLCADKRLRRHQINYRVPSLLPLVPNSPNSLYCADTELCLTSR